MAFDSRLLTAFVTVADELHFGRAAARLHTTQPAVSQQIKRLELQLGVELFARTRNSVELTEGGRAVLEPARAAVRAIAVTQEAAESVVAGEHGLLRLGFSPGAHDIALVLLGALGRRLPRLRLQTGQQSSSALARLLLGGELDIAIGFATEPMAGIAAETLTEEEAVLAVARTHPLAARDIVGLSDLRRERFALADVEDGAGYNAAVVAHCRAAGFEPSVPGGAHGPLVWESAVRSGQAVGLTTRTAASAGSRDIKLLKVTPRVTFPIELLKRSGEILPAAAQRFRELARDWAGGASEAPAPAALARQLPAA